MIPFQNLTVPLTLIALGMFGATSALLADPGGGGAGGGGPDDRFLTQPPTAPKQVKQKQIEPRQVQPKPSGTSAKDKKKDPRKSEQDFLERYKQAYLLAQSGEYSAAYVAFRALNDDDHPDVANHLGFISRRLGNYEDAKMWYERALAANPKHTRTWQYYGLWHLEQGNRLKAEEHLETIRAICGETCKDYASLKRAIDQDQASY